MELSTISVYHVASEIDLSPGHTVSVDARSMLEIGYEVDAWCGLYRCKSMWTITSINADTRYG